jgi:Family of unknown function (DUF6521)
VRTWDHRVIEVAYLFNPAFGATLIAEAVEDYNDKANHALPFAAAFLILPIVLHENTRRALPKSTITALLPRVQDHRENLVGFAERVQQLEKMTRESVLFGLQTQVRASLFMRTRLQVFMKRANRRFLAGPLFAP